MVRKKDKSKRLTLKDKYKVQKKVKDHNKKLRREAKKNPNARKRLNKEPGVPHLWPLKQEMLRKMTEEKREGIEEKKEEEVNKKRKRTSPEQLEAMMNDALAKQTQFEEYESLDIQDLGQFNQKDSSKKAFFKEFKKVVAAADVVLEVLDARDPLGSRSPTVEAQILKLDPNKKIILVLNKIDLVPKKNVEAWLAYLRNDYPCIAFKASTQQQKDRLGRGKISTRNATQDQLQVSECLGAETLLALLKNYSRSADLKRAISVGIIGFPNVGKSSLINSLKRSRAVSVGARPGVTKVTQAVTLDKNIKLIDCPGILFADDMSEEDAALRNCLNIDQLADCTLPVQAILARCTKDQLMTIYNIPLFADVTDFLRLVAERRGKILRGGVPNYALVSRTVVQDWNTGKIPYYCVPPEVDPAIHVSSEIMPTWSEAFKLHEVLQAEEETVMKELNDGDDYKFALARPQKSKYVAPNVLFLDLVETPYRKESLMMIDEVKEKTGPSPPKRARIAVDPNNPQTNSETKKKLTKQTKSDKKLQNKMILEEDTPQGDFDFGVDFWTKHPAVTTSQVPTEIPIEEEVDAFGF